MPISIIILAAGKGKRMMRDDLPKVLVTLAGKPLLGHVLDACRDLNAEKIVLIVGHNREKIIDYIGRIDIEGITYAVQNEQLGTGHAVDMARQALSSTDSDVLILAGDVPLITADTLDAFVQKHKESDSDCSVLSTTAPDPTGYGRIVRDQNFAFQKIVEHKDADDSIRRIDEINSGMFCVRRKLLFDALERLNNDNAQGEYYLTDIVEILKSDNRKVSAFNIASFEELQGVNSPEDLNRVGKIYAAKH